MTDAPNHESRITSGRTLVTSYVEPDLDGYGGAYGYAELLRAQGHDAVAGLYGAPIDEVQFVLGDRGIAPLDPGGDPVAFERVVLVDSSEPEHIDPRIALDRVVEVIDHRAMNRADAFPNAQLQIELIGAAATMVAERFLKAAVMPSAESAALLWGGIVSNTVNFRTQMTCERDREMAAWLSEVAALPHDYARTMFLAKSVLPGERLLSRLRSEFANYTMAGEDLMMCQLEIVGADALVATRLPELLGYLQQLKREEGRPHIFLSIVDVADGYNVLVNEDAWLQHPIEHALGVSFSGPLARRDGILMRKQILPLLKAVLEPV